MPLSSDVGRLPVMAIRVHGSRLESRAPREQERRRSGDHLPHRTSPAYVLVWQILRQHKKGMNTATYQGSPVHLVRTLWSNVVNW